MVRHLKLEPIDTTKATAAIDETDQLYGLDDVSFDEKSLVLSLAYDASHLCIHRIEDVLNKHGMTSVMLGGHTLKKATTVLWIKM